MRTVVVSDLHLGVATGADTAREPPARERLLEALAGADRVVILGDLLELRERPVRQLLDLVEPFFASLAEAVAGKRLVLVPGNHDHALGRPWLARARLDSAPLGQGAEWPVRPGDGIAGRLAEWLPGTELSLAYPGLRLRPDVYAIHGHYLDAHLTVPRLEALAAALMARFTGRGRDCRSTDDYEAVLAPLYAFHYELAQGVAAAKIERGAAVSRQVWARANGSDAGSPAMRFLLGRVTIPGAVAVLNRAGLGPFSAELSGAALRRSGLRAMADVVRGLGIEADHVLFGHTHRAGPQPDDDPAEWALPGGGRLWNTGTWYHETVLLGREAHASPYWPGTVVTLGDDGPPVIENVLRDVPLPAI